MKPIAPNESGAALFERDFVAWCERQASALRARRWADLDPARLAEEIDALGRAERRRLQSFLEIVFVHLLKMRYQPERRSPSWPYSVAEHARRVIDLLEEAPSLKASWAIVVPMAYRFARLRAASETSLALDVFPDAPTSELADDLDAALAAARQPPRS